MLKKLHFTIITDYLPHELFSGLLSAFGVLRFVETLLGILCLYNSLGCATLTASLVTSCPSFPPLFPVLKLREVRMKNKKKQLYFAQFYHQVVNFVVTILLLLLLFLLLLFMEKYIYFLLDKTAWNVENNWVERLFGNNLGLPYLQLYSRISLKITTIQNTNHDIKISI